MRPTSSDPRWSTLLAGVLVTLFSILTLSFGTLILSGFWARDVTDPSYNTNPRKPSTAKIVFCTGTMPFLTIFWTTADIGFALVGSLSPVHALISAFFLLCGWVAQFSIWLLYEVSAPDTRNDLNNVLWRPSNYLTGHEDARIRIIKDTKSTRSYFGIVIIVAAFIYMTLATVSLFRNVLAARISLPYHYDLQRELYSKSS